MAMIEQPLVREEELHALIDGELPAGRASIVAAVVTANPLLGARVAAFAADKAALAAAYRPIATAPVPRAWVARIERACQPPPIYRRAPRPAVWSLAVAASVLLAVGSATLLQRHGATEDPILAQADAARSERTVPLTRMAGAALADAPPLDALLARVVGLRVRAPDLKKLGWRLAEIDTYLGAAALRYHTLDGRRLTVFVRRSAGTPRFDLLKNGAERTCIWQDEVVGTVIMGEMSAGQMMRVASVAYKSLSL
jgi:anti-sigma factor RsiW